MSRRDAVGEESEGRCATAGRGRGRVRRPLRHGGMRPGKKQKAVVSLHGRTGKESERMAYLLNYTRMPVDEVLYDPKLAYSMHLALGGDGIHFTALNHNSGVLFAKATENGDGSLNPKSMKNPWLFQLPGGGFGVAAVRTGGDGADDEESRGCVLCFRTVDLLCYEELGLLKLGTDYVEEVRCGCKADSGEITVTWKERNGECFAVSVPGDAWRPSADGGLAPGSVPEVCGERMSGGTVEAGEDPADGKAAEGCEDRAAGCAADISGIEGAVPHNILEIPEETAVRLRQKLLTPCNIGIDFPETVEITGPEELEAYRATAFYSDGTSERKRVDWDLGQVDFGREGVYPITGRVHQEHFAFPVAENRADPCVCRWKGKYYFIATNDADDNHTLYIRVADTLAGLVTAEEYLLLDSTTYPGIGGLLWAPEFHEIGGKLTIFHAATPGPFFCEESHVMLLREGGDPVCREDWSAPRRVVKADGSDICEAGKEITLDMTCFEWQGKWYAVWSQRQFLPKDLGAWLYIAELDPDEPWRLLTEPVILSRPEYGWANNHTFVDEGPFALIREGRLYLTFSSAAVDTSYVVGLLTLEESGDPLQPHSWRKTNYPILTSRSVEGEFGTGHNAYVTDEDGNVWNTYHARPGVKGSRSSGIRRVHFDIDGEPVLDMTEDKDAAEEYHTVRTRLIVKCP